MASKPKGNPKNMKPVRSVEEAKEKGRKGGVNSGIARRHKKSLREHMQALLDSKVGNNKDGTPITGAEAMALAAFQSALKKDWKAWELSRDTSGNKPIDRVMVAEVDTDTINEVEKMVLGK